MSQNDVVLSHSATVTPMESTPTMVSKYNIVFKRISWHFPLVRLDNKLFVDVMFNQVQLAWRCAAQCTIGIALCCTVYNWYGIVLVNWYGIVLVNWYGTVLVNWYGTVPVDRHCAGKIEVIFKCVLLSL